MKIYTREQIEEAKKMDLLTYLQNYEPNELVRETNTQFCTKTHDSLKISNGFWNWCSVGIGGKNAVDYLMKVKDYSFIEAVDIILKNKSSKEPVYVPIVEKTKNNQLILPEKNSNNNRAISYLKQRGIDEEIIKKCIEKELIYEDKIYHNVVFVGYDENKKARYAGCRASNKSKLKYEACGSDKAYSFKIESEEKTDRIYVFEAAIDLLSYATLFKLYGFRWENQTMISLAGVYQPAKNIEQSKIPLVIENYLKSHPEIKKIILCLDNDDAGRNATKALQKVLPSKYEILDRPPKSEKDYNDYLCKILGEKSKRKELKIQLERSR